MTSKEWVELAQTAMHEWEQAYTNSDIDDDNPMLIAGEELYALVQAATFEILMQEVKNG